MTFIYDRTFFLYILLQFYDGRSKYVQDGIERCIWYWAQLILVSDEKYDDNGFHRLTLPCRKLYFTYLSGQLDERWSNIPKTGSKSIYPLSPPKKFCRNRNIFDSLQLQKACKTLSYRVSDIRFSH